MKNYLCFFRLSRETQASHVHFQTLHYLHHEEDCVEDDEEHDEVLEGAGHDHPPQFVLEAVSLLRHVALQGLGLDGEVNAGFLKVNRLH